MKYSASGYNLFISVVVPTCNRPDTLTVCIESILANDYPDYEIIIVDQSLNDDTYVRIRNAYGDDNKIIYLRSEIRCSSDSRNRGWQRAKGEIIAFTDDDAYVDKEWLSSIAEAFSDSHAPAGMVGGRIVPVFKIERPHWLPPEKDFLLPSFDAGNVKKAFPEGCLPISVNFALLRSLLEKTGGFDTRLGLKRGAPIPYITGEDSFLALKVMKAGGIVLYQPAAVVYHPVTAERLTRRFFLKRNFREGASTLAVENASSVCSDDRLLAHIRWHLKNIAYRSLLFCRTFLIPGKDRTRRYMLRASEIAFSLGVIHYSRHLRKFLGKAGNTL